MSEQKKIAILGGSFLQVDFVHTALKMGLEVHVLDGNNLCYLSRGENFMFKHIDFSNVNLVRNYCLINKIDLIYAPCNEIGNVISSQLAKEFQFRYNSEEVVLRTIDKGLQRKATTNLKHIKSPKSIEYSGDLQLILSKMTFPMVVKPSNTSAGRGITGVTNKEELSAAINEASIHLKEGGTILVEEFIKGKQLSVETVSVNGKHYIVGITEEIVGGSPLYIERCHYMNAEVHNKFLPIITDGILELLNAIGIEWGPCHIEIKVDENEVGLIEIASRAGGLRDRLMNNAGYPDYNELILMAYLSGSIDTNKLNPPTKHGLVNIMVFPEDIQPIVLGKRDKTLHSLYFYDKGPVYNPQNIIDSFGYTYFTSENELSLYGLN